MQHEGSPLGVIHSLNPENTYAPTPGAFFLKTCQRSLCVFPSSKISENFRHLPSHTELLTGTQAYELLLKIACGLESKVCGETEVFGQLKNVWQNYLQTRQPFYSYLNPWFQQLFKDTKEIRSLYLQNVGSHSYGSLVRKLIRRNSQNPTQEPALVIGAGQLANTIIPWLNSHNIWLWNRSNREIPNTRSLISPNDEAMGWKNATHIIVCIPIDPQDDTQRTQLLSKNNKLQTLIHLGGSHTQCEMWNKFKNFYSLDDIYALQHTEKIARLNQITLAKQACETKACFNIFELEHGWEDLPMCA
ncbi:MAG: hypothetical protein HY843_00380 [Bdellovibrio sp.]|nr:hypothetical protein [Bdellovibrio sp.]